MAWGANPANNSIMGLRALCSRWQGSARLEQVRSALRQQLQSSNTEVRMLASNTVGRLFDPVEAEQQLFERLQTESTPEVQEALLGALLDLSAVDPAAADRVLQNLSGVDCIASVNYRPDEEMSDLTRADGRLTRTLLCVFTRLALWVSTPFAAEAWAEWASHPAEAPATVRSLVQFSREAMKPRSLQPDDPQLRAFSFISELTNRILGLLAVPAEDATDEADSPRRAVVIHVAHSIAVELYFASGAFTNNVPPDEELSRMPEPSFVDLALPVLERLARVDDVPTAHQVVQTLVFLSRVKPRRALLAITDAALGAPGYEQEPQGEEAMFKLFDQILADDEDNLLNDDEYLTRVRQVLERYVDLASTAAISQIQRLSQSFR